MNGYLLVALGGAAGAAARHAVSAGALRAFGPGWPYGTFAVNLAGGFVMGLLAGWFALRGLGEGGGPAGFSAHDARLLLATGVLGGFTTFSAFSLEIVLMIERKALAQAGLYALASTALSVAAVLAGLALVRRSLA